MAAEYLASNRFNFPTTISYVFVVYLLDYQPFAQPATCHSSSGPALANLGP